VDDWQSRGAGSLLVKRLSARAAGENISHFTAMTATGNVRARRLLGKLGDVAITGRDGPTVSYRVALPGPVQTRKRRRPSSVVSIALAATAVDGTDCQAPLRPFGGAPLQRRYRKRDQSAG
jgi:hypothetical protein